MHAKQFFSGGYPRHTSYAPWDTKYHITSFYYDFIFYIMCVYVYLYVGIDLYSIQ